MCAVVRESLQGGPTACRIPEIPVLKYGNVPFFITDDSGSAIGIISVPQKSGSTATIDMFTNAAKHSPYVSPFVSLDVLAGKNSHEAELRKFTANDEGRLQNAIRASLPG